MTTVNRNSITYPLVILILILWLLGIYRQQCYHIPVNCDDNNPCTLDTCINGICDNIPFDYYVPNVFSPNNDGLNDYFEINGDVQDVRLKIFNRWGELVYEGDKWNGIYKGQLQTPQVFVYEAKFVMCGTFKMYIKGSVTLIR